MWGQKFQTAILQQLLTDMLYTLSEHHFVEDLSSSLANKPIYPVNIETRVAVTSNVRLIHLC